MSLHDDLLRQARSLAVREPRRPRQASLRRAVSAAYYALFHLFVHEATRRLVPRSGGRRLRHCLGRAFVHADMKTVAQGFAANNVSPKLAPALEGQVLLFDLVGVAGAFIDLQQARNEADYDTARRFTRRETLDLVVQAEQAFGFWGHVRDTLQADTFLVGLLAQRQMRV